MPPDIASAKVLTFADITEMAVVPLGSEGKQWNRHLFDAASSGTPQLVADVIRFEAGFVHHMHRHFHADQIVVPLEGWITMYDEHRTPTELRVGQASLVPRHIWHEARNLSGADCVVLHLFAGAGDYSEVGFEAWPGGTA
ncbi:cupin domain-containing protein [Pseudonocardia kujensis]|uniref:cupin domain-containing protein n=1 Tax=Pseudonocardia kujensis TaxID=1128675 RepID=UPI001E3B5D03|nr:cupin domain-containing protein [Pseudonocardia kujensis]MCE0765066.1 cupin domain-containing protein [Pseudonocardia kujensis]